MNTSFKKCTFENHFHICYSQNNHQAPTKIEAISTTEKTLKKKKKKKIKLYINTWPIYYNFILSVTITF